MMSGLDPEAAKEEAERKVRESRRQIYPLSIYVVSRRPSGRISSRAVGSLDRRCRYADASHFRMLHAADLCVSCGGGSGCAWRASLPDL